MNITTKKERSSVHTQLFIILFVICWRNYMQWAGRSQKPSTDILFMSWCKGNCSYINKQMGFIRHYVIKCNKLHKNIHTTICIAHERSLTKASVCYWHTCRCFRSLFCTMKAELGRGQLGLMRWIFMKLALEQYQTRDLLLWVQRANTRPGGTPVLFQIIHSLLILCLWC